MLSARRPCSWILPRFAAQRRYQVLDLILVILFERGNRRLDFFLEFAEQLAGDFGEVVDEVERVLDLVGDAGGELAERGHLLGSDQVLLYRLERGERGLGALARRLGGLRGLAEVPFRLAQCFLGPLALGDVLDEALIADELAGLVPHAPTGL